MEELREWFGDVFYLQIENTEHKEGFTSEYHSLGAGNYTLIELPYEEDITTVRNVIDWSSVSAVLFCVLTFVTVVTWLKKVFIR